MSEVSAKRSDVAMSHETVLAAGGARGRRTFSLLSFLPNRLLSLALLFLLAASGLVLIGYAVAWIMPGLVDSAEQRALHRAPLHSDHTALKTHVVRAFLTPKTLIYRDRNGSVYRALVDENELDRFVNDTLAYLEAERAKTLAELHENVDVLLSNAFSDRQDSIARYADWYFGWGQSYYLLKEASVGALKGLGPNNVQGFAEGARNEVAGYLIRNYQDRVLKPELRELVIEAGVARIFAKAHQHYLQTLTSLDDRLQEFLSKYTRHLEVVDPLKEPDLSIDWDAQKWKVSRYSVENEALQAVIRGAGGIVISGLIARAVGPTVERALAQGFMAIAGRAIASMQPEIYGAAAGSFAEPGVGTAIGWAVGAGGGILFDYAVNRAREHLGREEFEQASKDALDATIGELSRALQRDLSQAVDVWFDDTRAIVAEQKFRKK
ncbi:hypothetical protein JQ614_17250 [Bradyrhizobium diazoefficiens]|uniref:hypothetical protein n=1 Tax=Bradyrhizobium diazoefficiens TaxID=1355477 RepID=UPI001B8B9E90|nr:hypothetical protein [Bradyrhizobium diazoefficiens]MBR0863487.1 hypothetical protein [Bradyrhizobium diazoefficiens]MBR0888172.1 hypothetical protein [Bradyrhizobium diazoefficiens]MBR0919813.1 hypothetical protein [Bradyrhizobium diazoefficiens]